MAIGSFFLVFGLFFALLAGTMINELYGYFYNYQSQIAYAQITGITLAAIGAGFLAYGYALRSENLPQNQSSL